jgi:hypothetical protein
MSKEEMDRIMDKALSDEAFRSKLLEDPIAACQPYDVTGEELAEIIKSCKESFAGELDARISKRKMGRFGGFSGPMGIDDIVE